jgi:probable rRNA maturation factor
VINFFNENVDYPNVDYRSVKKWITTIIEIKGFKTGAISIIFCSDIFILDYNIRFLSHNYFTDIITFNYNNKNKISGDLFISVDSVKRNAIDYNVNENEEFLRVIIHGILHLIGYNDNTDEECLIMREQEAKALNHYTIL